MGWSREELLEAVIGQAPGMVTILEGSALRITYATPAVVDLLRRPLVGFTLEELFPGNRAVEIARHVYRSGDAVSVFDEPLYKDTSDSSRFFNRTYTPLKDRGGTVQGIMIVAHEVTKSLHERVEQQEGELRHREEIERVFALVEEAPMALAILEPPDWKILMANRELRRLLGDHVVGNVTLRGVVPSENKTLRAVENVYATGQAETFEAHSQVEGWADRAFSMTCVPIRNREGAITQVMVASIEITEHRRATQALVAQARDLDRARQEAVEAARAKDQFLAMLGHELRNPLQPMLTAVQLMRLDGQITPSLEMLEREVHYMTRLVDDLLDISRFSRGVITLEPQLLDLRTIITRGLELASPLLEQRGHRVLIDLESRSLSVSGDLQRLTQVVSNLLHNAAKFSDPGSQIRIFGARKSDRIVLRVADDGTGIQPEMLPRIFDAFVQAGLPLRQVTSGLGLGLAIVKSLVEAHYGTISAYSEGLGRGTTFVVELPALDEAAKQIDERQPQLQRRDPAQQAVHVMVVDDNHQVADILRTGLSAIGYTVTVAYDGPTALALAKTSPPQIALLDIGLPGMDGYQLGEALRAAHGIPLVAITGYGQVVDAERSFSAGFSAHRVKPVDLGELTRLIENLAGIRVPPNPV